MEEIVAMEKMEMTRKEADLCVLKMFLAVFLTETGEAVKRELARMIAVCKENAEKKLEPATAMIWNTCNPELVENFIKGYDKAVAKYGIDEANARMQERILETILKYEDYYSREELINRVRVLYAAADIATKAELEDGINLERDEDGNYHEI